MDDNEVWAAVDRHRLALASILDGLNPGQWQASSLCEGWTVRDVVAHLTMPLLSMRELLVLGLRHPGGVNTVIREGSITLAKRYEIDELRQRVRRLVGHHRPPMPVLTCREVLIDTLAHTLDIAIPLGLPTAFPAVDVAEAADRIVSYRGRGNARVFRSLPSDGFRLIADDHPWSTGDGREVRGELTCLFLLLSGRTVWVDRLHGPGADELRHRLAGHRLAGDSPG